MNDVNKTLYIPLYGKSLVSKKGIILADKKAEEIWDSEKFPLKRKSRSKWLAYYMGMRSAVFDKWVKEKSRQYPDCVILHLGCGLDSRVMRVELENVWFDVDFPSVIDERRKYYTETESYRMISADIKEKAFMSKLPEAERAVVVLEGVSMYLTNSELQGVFLMLREHFSHLSVLIDCYTPFGAKMSKIKNPVKDVGVSKVFGVERPNVLEHKTGFKFLREHDITPRYLIDELHGSERRIFQTLYAGRISKKTYKLYEYEA